MSIAVQTDDAAPQAAEVAAAPGQVGESTRSTRRRRLLFWVAGVLALAVGIVLRFVAVSDLWLDEALSVNIARPALPDLFAALRIDGSPPAYYVLLHAWMSMFGSGDIAVRALSGVLSVASLPVAWLLARRLGGDRMANAALLVIATSPFAIRYATETRMYSLLVLLTLAGGLALTAVLQGARRWPALGLAVVSGLLALTHYWAVFLLATVAGRLLYGAIRGPHADRCRRALAALVGGQVLFLPWLPSFLYQLGNTGTPWGKPGGYGVVTDAARIWSGAGDVGAVLAFVLTVLALLGIAGASLDDRRILLDLRGRSLGRELALLSYGTLAVAITLGLILRSASADRYTAVAFAPFVLLVALGLQRLASPRVRTTVITTVVVLGLAAGTVAAGTQRTQAGRIAEELREQVKPGDVVAFCPDQLGPAVSRLLPAGMDLVTFPDARPPERVYWPDYADRNRERSAVDFASDMDKRAGPGTVWLVWAPGYRSLYNRCTQLADALALVRRQIRVVSQRSSTFESASLVRYDVPRPPGGL